MSGSAEGVVERSVELAYPRLKTALALYSRPPPELSPPELQEVERQVRRQYALEQRILQAPEAAMVVVAEPTVQAAVASIAAKYDNRTEFLADLERNGLDESVLEEALARELKVEAVVERVSAGIEPPSLQDVEIFYYQHRERFHIPEQRTVRHILITINPDYAENSPAAAQQRMAEIQAAVARGESFVELAQRHSECPSALEGGLLGTVTPGKLFPELEAALFSLEEGAVSGPVESELGLHLLWCEQVEPERQIPLTEVAEKIRDSLTARARERHLRRWLASRN